MVFRADTSDDKSIKKHLVILKSTFDYYMFLSFDFKHIHTAGIYRTGISFIPLIHRSLRMKLVT